MIGDHHSATRPHNAGHLGDEPPRNRNVMQRDSIDRTVDAVGRQTSVRRIANPESRVRDPGPSDGELPCRKAAVAV